MNNKVDVASQFARMKQLMSYGINEGKNTPYSNVEYSKVAADGKLYGIVREGTKYYIKVSNKRENPLTENFEYIGGFRNRKDNEYSGFAMAQKNFDLKLRSLAEAYAKRGSIVVESWNPDKNEELTVESTDKMKKEIARQRQIMENVSAIRSGKPQALDPLSEGNCSSDPFCENPDKEFKDSQKDNVKADKSCSKGIKGKCADAKVNEGEVLGWNRNPDYMDKSHGTQIGDSAPFDDAKGKDIDDAEGTSSTSAMKNGVVEEGEAVIDNPNDQNKPAPGVGEIGDNQPFNGEKGKQIDEAIDDIENNDLTDDAGEVVNGDEGASADDALDMDGDDEYAGDDEDLSDDDVEEFDVEVEDEPEDMDAEGGDIKGRLSALEDLIGKIADKLGVDEYEDDDLYDDEEGFEGDDEDFVDDEDYIDNGYAEEDGMEDDEFGDEDEYADNDEDEVYETRSYRAMRIQESNARMRRMNEAGMKPFSDAGRVPSGNIQKLNDFGKHPAYQKKVMELPPKDMSEFPGYYDMNDESAYSDAPYGEKIGDSAPFSISPESIDNAISESINRFLKKK